MGTDKISSSRNNGLEFYRFIFSLIVCLLHFRSGTLFQSQPTAFYGGYLAVDFFFIASGLFLAENFLKKSDGNSFVAAKEKMMWEFLHKKVLRLYPAYFCALVLSAFIKVVFCIICL